MPTQSLASLPGGTNVFIDANIFIHGLSGQSAQCWQLLERCSREEVTGITLYEILNEATHQFMLAEAVAKKHISLVKPADQLRAKFRIVSVLTDYWRQTERMLSLNLLFLSTEESIVRRAQVERAAAGLLTNDSMIVACMRQYGIQYLASRDRDFERANGITVFRPDDV